MIGIAAQLPANPRVSKASSTAIQEGSPLNMHDHPVQQVPQTIVSESELNLRTRLVVGHFIPSVLGVTIVGVLFAVVLAATGSNP